MQRCQPFRIYVPRYVFHTKNTRSGWFPPKYGFQSDKSSVFPIGASCNALAPIGASWGAPGDKNKPRMSDVAWLVALRKLRSYRSNSVSDWFIFIVTAGPLLHYSWASLFKMAEASASRKSDGAKKTRKQRFKTEYTHQWPFIIQSKKGPFHAFCTYCASDFTFSHGGRNDVGQHIKTKAHEKNTTTVRETKSISSFFSSANSDE